MSIDKILPIRQLLALLLSLFSLPVIALAQPALPETNNNDGAITQTLVDSRCGYVLRLPAEARLDSATSGWNPIGRFERRVYVIDGAGEIYVTVTVLPQTIPQDAVNNGAYLYSATDSATSSGTASVRTYWLPTRSVRIAIVPHGIRMRKYLDAAETIFSTFRWKPGATTNNVETDPPTILPFDNGRSEQSTPG